MSIRTPSPSRFRPARRIDQSFLAENKALIEKIDRRKVLRGSLSLGALALLVPKTLLAMITGGPKVDIGHGAPPVVLAPQPGE